MHERAKSLIWLDSLESPAWDRTHEHAQLGPLSAGDLLTSWAAHDLLHLRQLTALRFGTLAHGATPFTPDYAGPW